ncbi:PilN domain-containing protein [Campylobacter mucosalis]|uniref:PilN domain-containing protein n=1 Tax=Campylobacter mucosalis TaxID=202 RepID=UPI00146FDF3F|nr:hypothetical protein [Campylobacter mucosalis]
MFSIKNIASNIITIDSYAETSFIFSGGISLFSITQPLSLNKNNLYISYIKFKQLMYASIDVPKGIKDDEILNIITTKTYEELGLDASLEYKIAYIQSPEDNQNTITFNVFAADNKSLNQQFISVAKNTACIDYLLPAPLLYNALYGSEILSSKGDFAECFINLSKDDAFIAVYKNGEFMTTKPLRYTLNFIKDKFSELTGERMSEQLFFEKFANANILSDDEFSKNLKQILDEYFAYIYDIIHSIERIHSVHLGSIFLDTTFFNTSIGELGEKILERTLNPLKTGINFKHQNFSNTHALMILYGKNQELLEDELNFSIFKRPEPLYKRQSGQLLITCLVAGALAFLYPTYNYTMGYYYKIKEQNLQSKFEEETQKIAQLKQESLEIKDREKELKDKISKEQERLKSRQNLLEQIVKKKEYYTMKSALLYDLGNAMYEHNVLLKSFALNENNITLEVTSSDNKHITDLITYISNGYTVDTKQIKRTQNGFDSNISLELQ